MFKNLIPLPELELTNIKSIKINKTIIKPLETKDLYKSKYLPLTTDISYFGNLLVGSIKHKYIKKLINNMKFLGKVIPESLGNLGSDISSKIFLRVIKIQKWKKNYLI